MSLIKALRKMEQLTQSEQEIRDYILRHPERIAEMSARELGEVTYTSAATVTRFSKKLGCKGYPDLKIRFLSEAKAGGLSDEEQQEQISEQENTMVIMDKVEKVLQKAVSETKSRISMEQMVRIGDMLHEAEYIDFYVYDVNVHLAGYGASNFFYTGKTANVYTATNTQELVALRKQEKHLAVLISHTGENSRLVQIARTLKRNDTPMIIITCDKDRRMAQVGGEVLYSIYERSVEQLGTVMFGASVKYLLDVMFCMTFSRKYRSNVELNQTYDKYGKALWALFSDYSAL